MDSAVEILSKSIAAFEASSRKLLDRHLCDTDVHLRLQKFIHGCRCACTANMNWRSVISIYLCLEFVAELAVQSPFGTIQARPCVLA